MKRAKDSINLREMTTSTPLLIVMLLLGFGMIMASCKGSTGPKGDKGEQGEQGLVGPAGEDGSMMYAGEGAPASDLGSNGDYYLDTNTGEYYGPKDGEGWGSPIIVLMGEDGQNGADGSQIHSGSGVPDASMGAIGDYYLDKGSYELYGPKTGSGWGTPLNLKGADGNANVTRYIASGHDFSSEISTQILITGVENTEESVWLVYLHEGGFKYPVPGYGDDGATEYTTYHGPFNAGTAVDVRIRVIDGPGEAYTNIYVIQIEPSITEELNKAGLETSIMPEHLDTSNYEEVAEYYNFRN